MSANWQELLYRMLDGDELSDGEARALADALGDETVRDQAADWLAFEAQLRGRLDPQSASDAELTRERLLAKALLREKAAEPRGRRVSRRKVLATAAAAVLVVIAGSLWWTVGHRYPPPQAEGDLRIVPAGVPLEEADRIQRGDRIVAGPGGARVSLGGYCHLDIDPGALLAISGEPRMEAIELETGRVRSHVDAHRGQFRIITVAGTIDVVGTEFVTTVQCPPSEGGKEMRKLSAVVTVAVVAGAVVCHFGESVIPLGEGESCVFAAERAADDVPDGLKGFRGMMIGTIVSKTDNTFVLKVEKITKIWKQNKAKDAESAIGKSLLIDISRQSRLVERHLRTLRGLKAGDRVVVEAFHFEGNRLSVVEALEKAE